MSGMLSKFDDPDLTERCAAVNFLSEEDPDDEEEEDEEDDEEGDEDEGESDGYSE